MKRLILAISCSIAYAPFAMATDLNDIYCLALESDPTFKAQEGSFRVSKQAIPQAIARFFPTINAQATTTGVKANSFVQSPLTGIYSEQTRHFNQKSYNLNLSQPIYHPELWSALDQAMHVNKKALASFLAASQDLILRVSEQYFAILSAQDTVHFTKAQRTAFARQLEQAKQRFDVGLIAITDVLESKAKHDNAIADEITAENALSDQYEKLAEIIGQPSDDIATLKVADAQLLASPEPNNLETWVDIAQQQNLDIQVAKEDSLSAKSEIANRMGAHFPTVDLSGSLQKSKSQAPTFDNLLPQQTLSLNVAIPLFNGGLSTFRVKEAQATYSVALARLDLQRRTIFSETRQRFRGVLTQISRVKSFAQAVISNQSALEATRAAYEVGSRTIVNVLDAETELLNAQRNHAKARYDYILEGLRLKRAAGTLKADDLYAINCYLGV